MSAENNWPITKLGEVFKRFILELINSFKNKKEDNISPKTPVLPPEDKEPIIKTEPVKDLEEKSSPPPKQNQVYPTPNKNQTLDRNKIAEMASSYGLDVASVLAVAEVESSGRSGFQKTGLLTVLFEAHIFYRELKKAGLNPDVLMTKYPTLISPIWNRSLYKGGDAENSRLAEALNIHECAWNCASYGMFQIMGFNHQACGFNTAREFVDYLKRGQEAHVETFLKFISSDSKKINTLKNKDWATFAYLYNGPTYAQNKYDIKLAEAYQKHNLL